MLKGHVNNYVVTSPVIRLRVQIHAISKWKVDDTIICVASA